MLVLRGSMFVLVLATVPVPAEAQRAQPVVTSSAATSADTREGGTTTLPGPNPTTPAPTAKRRPSAARYAAVGAISGLVLSTALLIGIAYEYGNGGLPPIYVTGVVTAGGLTFGAIGGLVVYGVVRVARR